MLIVGLEDVDVTGTVLMCDGGTVCATAVLSVAACQDEAGAPHPWMGVHLVIRIRGNEMVQEDGGTGTSGCRVPPCGKVAFQVRLALWADVLDREDAGQ